MEIQACELANITHKQYALTLTQVMESETLLAQLSQRETQVRETIDRELNKNKLAKDVALAALKYKI